MGDEAADAPSADVSAVGTLVWVRRPNGSWWPGRVVSPLEVPDCCPAPPRSLATPILLLGRRDGPVFVDWFNLERSKRVKPFRCGERGLEDCIRRAQQQQQAAPSLRSRTTAAGSSRYARKDDAVLQALDIERASLRLRSSTPTTANTSKPSHSAAADAQPSSRKRRKTPNDSEDDPPQRMKDLTDIGAPPKQPIPSEPMFSDLDQHLPRPGTSQIKRSKQSHHDSPKRKQRPSVDQDQPCGFSRKRDRSRPLSELCNGDVWKNGCTPNGQRTGPSLDMVLDTKSSSRRAVGPVKTEPVDDDGPGNTHLAARSTFKAGGLCITRSSSHRAVGPVKTGPVGDEFLRGDDEPVHAHLATSSTFKADHFHVHQPCASTKAPTLECTKRASNCSKDGISSQCDSRNSKKRTTSFADHEVGNRTKTVPEREHYRETVANHKAQSDEVVLLEKRVQKSMTANKAATPDDDKDCAVISNGLDHVGAVLQQHSESKCKHEEPSESISNHSNCENVPAPSLVIELPPQHRDSTVTTCHAVVKPVKTLQLNSSLYDVDLNAQGVSSSNSKGGRVPLVSLMSRSSRRPVVGYPVSVEVIEDTAPCPPAPSIHDDHPSTSNHADRPAKEEAAAAVPQREGGGRRAAQVTRAKSRRKAVSEDESWRPHTKNSHPAAAASPRKMRRLSSFAPSQRRGGGDGRLVAGELCSRGPALACVPLRLVFSRIHEALSHLGK